MSRNRKLLQRDLRVTCECILSARVFWMMQNSLERKTRVDTLYGGYTHEQLHESFNLVTADMEDWKMPIDVVLPAGTDTRLVDYAITYFTGSVATIIHEESGNVRIAAEGYYMSMVN
jgi:hypothetical protein